MSVIVRADKRALEVLAARFGVTVAAVDSVVAESINFVAAPAVDRARKMITVRVRLTDAYVSERMTFTRANAARPAAVIKTRERATRLATYASSQAVAANTRAGGKGDGLRGIAPGMKQAGVTTGVRRDRTLTKLQGAFLIPLRAGRVGGGNGLGIFTRERGTSDRKAIRHRYGPSVNQLFTGVAEELEEPLLREIEDRLLAEAASQIQKISEGL